MKTAREIAHELHPVQMATCCCDGGATRAPGAYCKKATAIISRRDREVAKAFLFEFNKRTVALAHGDAWYNDIANEVARSLLPAKDPA